MTVADKWFAPRAQEGEAGRVESSSIHETGTKLPRLTPRTGTMHLTLDNLWNQLKREL